MADIVCLDTHILIWGIQKTAREGQEHLIPRTEALLIALQKRKATVVVPAIVVAEFLVGIPSAEQPRFADIINQNFIVIPFDMAVAPHFARIWHKKKDVGGFEHLKHLDLEHIPTRAELKADLMIIATAVSLKAKSICGHDKPMARLCEGEIKFDDVATMPLQGVMEGILNRG